MTRVPERIARANRTTPRANLERMGVLLFRGILSKVREKLKSSCSFSNQNPERMPPMNFEVCHRLVLSQSGFLRAASLGKTSGDCKYFRDMSLTNDGRVPIAFIFC